jgi:maltose alpha-D-glucosyltransferase/alpha-amylase
MSRWLNPCFESPFWDAGYDVADYYKVAPRYGTNADLKRLFKEADRRNIKVCLDLVAGHTSIEHSWFKQSCRATKNRYSNYYIWTNDWFEGDDSLPNMIKGFGQRNGNYLANFFWSQPALNYGFAEPDPAKPWQFPPDHPACRAVRREIKKVICYWLDQGAAGFRVDMASELVKKDKNWKITSQFWHEVRAMLDSKYPQAVLISEWSYPKTAIRCGFHIDLLLHCNLPAYTSLFRQEKGHSVMSDTDGHSFFRKAGKGNIDVFLKDYLDHYLKTKNSGYISIPTGNHDLPRISLSRTQKEIELVFAFILTMPGIPMIYYGDEIGMKYLKGLRSKEGGYFRTGSRTPMQWSKSLNAGFSRASAAQLYLPLDKNKNRPNVETQRSKPGSLLNKVKKLIALRQQNPALCADGDFIPIYAQAKKYPFVYLRRRGRQKFLLAFNPSGKPVKAGFVIKDINKASLICNGVELLIRNDRCQLKMAGLSYGIFRV